MRECLSVRVCRRVGRPSARYLHVGRVSLAVPPGAGHRGEGPVRVVEFPSLEVEEEGGEGLLQGTGSGEIGKSSGHFKHEAEDTDSWSPLCDAALITLELMKPIM